MAEYVMNKDDDQGEVAKALLEHAGDRQGEVKWLPRPDKPQGGVFFLPDDLAEGFSSPRLGRIDEEGTNTDPETKDGSTVETDDKDDSGQSSRQSRAAARRAAQDRNKE